MSLEGRIEVPNGVTIHFEEHGNGDALVLLHGFSGSSADWKPILDEWGAMFHLIIPDLRGHGRSSTLSAPFRHRDAAGDVFAVLDHLNIKSCKGIGVNRSA